MCYPSELTKEMPSSSPRDLRLIGSMVGNWSYLSSEDAVDHFAH